MPLCESIRSCRRLCREWLVGLLPYSHHTCHITPMNLARRRQYQYGHVTSAQPMDIRQSCDVTPIQPIEFLR